jgi:hypothetical protein
MSKESEVKSEVEPTEEGMEDLIEVNWIEYPLGCYQDKVAYCKYFIK